MEIRAAIPDDRITSAILNPFLEGTTRLNEELIRAGKAPTFSTLVKQLGVRWRPEPVPGRECFDHVGIVARRGHGDCDDLAPIEAASLRVSGQDPGARAVVVKTGPNLWHAIVRRTTGWHKYTDPSQTAGMNVRKGSVAAGIPPAVVGVMHRWQGINGDECRPSVHVTRLGMGWTARTDLPFRRSESAWSVTRGGGTPALALSRSLQGAVLVGGASQTASEDHLAKLHAMSKLLRGYEFRQVVGICGYRATKEAVDSLRGIAPAIGHRLAASPFDRAVVGFDFGQAFNSAAGWVNDNVVKPAQQAIKKVAQPALDVANKLNIPLVNISTALLTGQNPIEALKKDLGNFQNAAQLAQAVKGGDYAKMWQQVTQNGAIHDPQLPAPPGLSYLLNAVPNVPPLVKGASILIPPGH